MRLTNHQKQVLESIRPELNVQHAAPGNDLYTCLKRTHGARCLLIKNPSRHVVSIRRMIAVFPRSGFRHLHSEAGPVSLKDTQFSNRQRSRQGCAIAH